MITMTERGLYCEAGGFYIDPHKRVDVALITHAHSDHARKGSRHYVCAQPSVGLLKLRLGENIQVTGVPYRQTLQFGQVTVSFHPAGHMLGSAQIRVQLGNEVWVASGDYKRQSDASCEPFEVVPCHTFITEATFGNSHYQWDDSDETVRRIHKWWMINRELGRNSLLYCYAVGKTQRVLAELYKHTQERVLVFGEAGDLTDAYRAEGVQMVPTQRLEEISQPEALSGELIIAPHSIARTPWIDRLGDVESAFASGWMQSNPSFVRGRYDTGFVLSDHADWPALVQTIQETGAKRVLVLHGGNGELVRYLRKQGLHAAPYDWKSVQNQITAPLQGELFAPGF